MATIPKRQGHTKSKPYREYVSGTDISKLFKSVENAYIDAQKKSQDKYPYDDFSYFIGDARDAYRHYTGALEGAKSAGFFPSLLAGVGHELQNLWDVREIPSNYGKAAKATYQDIINNFLGLQDYVTGNVREPKDLYYLSSEEDIGPIVDPSSRKKEEYLLDWWETR